MHRGDFMFEKKYFVQKYQDTSCIFEIRAMFGNQTSLETILAERALKEINIHEKNKEMACLPENSEV